MSTPTLYVTILLILGAASAAVVCYRLLRRGLPEDYLSVAVLAGLIVFVVAGIGGPFLYAYAQDIPLLALSGMAFLSAFGGMALALVVAWGIFKLRRADRTTDRSSE